LQAKAVSVAELIKKECLNVVPDHYSRGLNQSDFPSSRKIYFFNLILYTLSDPYMIKNTPQNQTQSATLESEQRNSESELKGLTEMK